MPYRRLPVDLDHSEQIQQAFGRIAELFPGWQPREGHLEVAILEECARMVVEAAQVASAIPDRLYADFGRQVFGIVQVEGVQAEGLLKVTAWDDLGYVLPAGTVVAAPTSGDEQVDFGTSETVTIDPGDVDVEVPVVAVEPGTDGNHRTGTVELVDQLAWVEQTVLIGTTAGGVDPETDSEYLDRLQAEIRLAAPRPIVADDYSVLAARVGGVRRAATIDGGDRTVTVIPVGDDGQPVGQTVKDEVEALLESKREINFVVHVDDPTYVSVSVTVQVQGPQTVAAAVDRAVRDWLDPATWGGAPVWQVRDRIGHLELAGIVARVPDVHRVVALTLNGTQTDVLLSGVAPLPDLVHLSVSVT